MCECECVCVCVCVCVSVRACKCMCTCLHICMHANISAHVGVMTMMTCRCPHLSVCLCEININKAACDHSHPPCSRSCNCSKPPSSRQCLSLSVSLSVCVDNTKLHVTVATLHVPGHVCVSLSVCLCEKHQQTVSVCLSV